MARRHSKSGKKRTHRQRKHRQRGGGWGFKGPESIPGTPGIVSNPMVYTGIGDCRAVKPGYDIPYSQYSASLKGLPGMSGGKRRASRKGRGRRTRKQRGGRYGFFPEGINQVTPNGAAWWAGTYGPVQRIACEGSTPNPLNPGPHTPSTQPLPVASSSIPMPQSGGAQHLAPATVGVGNVDSMYYYAPTAGYANTASTWKDSVGAPVQIQVPFAARAMNQACLSTGGHPPLTGALQKGGSQVTTDQRGGKRRKTRKGGAFYGVPTSMNNLRSLGSQLTGLFGVGATVASTPEASAEVEAIEISEPEGGIIPPNGPGLFPPANNAVESPIAPAAEPMIRPNGNMMAPPTNSMNAPINQPYERNQMNEVSVLNESPIVIGGRGKRHRKQKKTTRKHKGRKH